MVSSRQTSLVVDPPDGRVSRCARGGEDSRRGRRAELGLVRVHEPVGSVHHARRPGGFFPAGYNNALPDPADARLRRHPLRDDPRRPHHPDRRARRTCRATLRFWDGDLGRPVGGQHAGRRRRPTTTARAGSPPTPRPGASEASRRARRCTSSSASRAPAPTRFTTRSPSTIPRSTRGRGRSRFPSSARTAT